jgi:hypothetical protein
MTAPPRRDRRAALAAAGLNGLDFVEIVDTAQTQLRVHFINALATGDLAGPPRITGGETIAQVPVLPFGAAGPAWSFDGDHLVLDCAVAAPGDFSQYTLTIAAPAIDPFFGSVAFSFKAGCPSDVDCAVPVPDCPPAPVHAPRIDYLAKDFLSFRQALLDYSTQYYPEWQERSEADFGMMFAEALSALGDDLSYLQDRVAGEATLATATERRSVLRHAALVDYQPGRTLSAATVLQFEVSPDAPAAAPDGIAVSASGDDGTAIVFETGGGLNAVGTPVPLDPRWNRAAAIMGYWFDDGARCLPAGATTMTVSGHGHGFQASQTLLIVTAGAAALDPPLRQLVHLLGFGDPAGPWATETFDTVFADAGSPMAPHPITTIAWRAADALTVARDLWTTQVIGNLVPATQGQSMVESFAVATDDPALPGAPPFAIERAGPSPSGADADRPVLRLHTLGGSTAGAGLPVAWLGGSGSSQPAPEIRLTGGGEAWTWLPTIIEAQAATRGFTLDPAAYRALTPNADGTLGWDYAGAIGDTIRFGDGVLGANPQPGEVFTVVYRLGVGAAGNVAADAIGQVAPAANAGWCLAVGNPFAAIGGADAESLLSIARNAPQAFRANQPRAITPADYVAAAVTLPWVRRAGCAQRWTGSWFTTFTTPQPAASDLVSPAERLQLVQLLNRRRMAGSESYAPDPDYVSIDLRVSLCPAPGVSGSQVTQAVAAALAPSGAGGSKAFFAIGRFGFGDPLYRGDLEVAIQAVPGIGGVTRITYRLRDRWREFQDMGNVVAVGAAQILRCDNDRSRPDAGALSITIGGG